TKPLLQKGKQRSRQLKHYFLFCEDTVSSSWLFITVIPEEQKKKMRYFTMSGHLTKNTLMFCNMDLLTNAMIHLLLLQLRKDKRKCPAIPDQNHSFTIR